LNYFLNLDVYRTQKQLIDKIIGGIARRKPGNGKSSISDLINQVNT